jgi:hypothetical protein
MQQWPDGIEYSALLALLLTSHRPAHHASIMEGTGASGVTAYACLTTSTWRAMCYQALTGWGWHTHRGTEGESDFKMVTGIVPASLQIQRRRVCGPIVEVRVISPRNLVIWRQLAAALGFIEQPCLTSEFNHIVFKSALVQLELWKRGSCMTYSLHHTRLE